MTKLEWATLFRHALIPADNSTPEFPGASEDLMNTDILQAETNWIEQSNGAIKFNGPMAAKLVQSSDLTVNPFAYSVWELTGDYHDWRTDCANPVAILRANQTTLGGALQYMSENRILVWNKDEPEL